MLMDMGFLFGMVKMNLIVNMVKIIKLYTLKGDM